MKDCGLVSIITPNYNCERFIQDTIISVQNQTYTNWEMLIVDDCSTDSSLEILRKASLTDSRIKILSNNINSGAAISRNYAIREAKGEWIAFLDSDDLWHPVKLEKQLNFMIVNNYHASFTDSIYVDENGKPIGLRETGPLKVGYKKLLLFNFLSTCSVMYNKEKVGLIQIPNLKKRNDYAMWFRISRRVPFYLLNDPLTLYRIRTFGNLSGKSKGLFGQRSLLKDHYLMFRKNEQLNILVSFILVILNIIGYFVKKVLYIKKYKTLS